MSKGSRFPIFWLLKALLLVPALAYSNSAWQPLFNGQDLNGWLQHGGGATYAVENGAIVGTNGDGPNTFLTTQALYENFELEFQVLLDKPFNSGVQIRSHFRDEWQNNQLVTRVFGPQVEIEQSPGESGYLYGEQLGTGWLTEKIKLKEHSVFKNNDWNHYRIVANGPRIQVWLNGQSISDYTDQKIFSLHHKGFIGLQVHASKAPPGTWQVKWKNIRIKKLPTSNFEWKTIFNGRNLAGWTPKITGYEVGENPGDIFKAEQGVLKIGHGHFDGFKNRFGHLFYNHPKSVYKLRLEYRFLDGSTPGGPSYGFRNSGIMIHGQDPTAMALSQRFPTSIEVQLRGSDDTTKLHTANVCTPGTNIKIKDKLQEKHCIDSSSKYFVGDQWVQAEIHVNADKEIIHYINGEEVLRYQNPQLDNGLPLSEGTISIQAESHDLEIRHIEIMESL